jgi:hypothetical protein
MIQNRRSFIRSSLGLVVVSAVTPGEVLGRILPDSLKNGEAGSLLGTFTLNIRDFPELQQVRGVVKLHEPSMLMNLNPDHCAYFDPLLPAPARGRYPIAVCRVAKSGPDAIRAVSTLCSHGVGYQLDVVSDRNECVFVCPHLYSSFKLDGRWIPPSRSKHAETDMTPDDLKDLRTFPTTFDETTGSVTIHDLTLGVCEPEISDIQSLSLEWVDEFRNDSLRIYRLSLPEETQVRLTMTTSDGVDVQIVTEGRLDRGVHHVIVPVDPTALMDRRIVLETGIGREYLPLE